MFFKIILKTLPGKQIFCIQVTILLKDRQSECDEKRVAKLMSVGTHIEAPYWLIPQIRHNRLVTF